MISEPVLFGELGVGKVTSKEICGYLREGISIVL